MTSLILREGNGVETPLTELAIDSADRFHISARIFRELPAGSYTVIWRTAASDGHPTSGAFEFTILGVGALSAASERQLDTARPIGSQRISSTPTSRADENMEAPFQVFIRLLSLAALVAVVGAVAFRYAVVSRLHNVDSVARATVLERTSWLGAGAAAGLLVLSPIRLHLQAGLMPEHTGNSAQTLMTHTGWGAAWMLYTAGATIALTGFAAARFRKSFGWVLAAIGVAILALGASLSGHAGASARWVGLAVVVDALHIVGAGGWMGSLLFVVAALPIFADRRQTGATVAQLVNAFSPTALGFAGLVILTGLISAWLRLGAVSALWSSAYGRVLILKLVALAGVAATGAYNWKCVKPLLSADTATTTFRRSARVELAIGALVILLTAILVATPTPTDLS